MSGAKVSLEHMLDDLGRGVDEEAVRIRSHLPDLVAGVVENLDELIDRHVAVREADLAFDGVTARIHRSNNLVCLCRSTEQQNNQGER